MLELLVEGEGARMPLALASGLRKGKWISTVSPSVSSCRLRPPRSSPSTNAVRRLVPKPASGTGGIAVDGGRLSCHVMRSSSPVCWRSTDQRM